MSAALNRTVLRVFMVGLGGVGGALARYGFSLLLNERGLLPWGTLAVNLLGCFLLALFLTVALSRLSGSSYFVLAVATGFVGSFTTFSAISVEGVLLMQNFAGYALLYLGLTLTGGYACTWAGCAAGSRVLGTGWGEKWSGKVSAGVDMDD